MLKKLVTTIFTVCLVLVCMQAKSQAGKDTAKASVKRPGLFHNIFKQVRNAVTVSKKDSAVHSTIINSKSEIPFQRYDGRIIRSITTEELGFEQSFTDTTKRIRYLGTRILNALHFDSRDWVIRNNLFFRENTRLNSYTIADNERYLRSLNFIRDARILVKPVSGSRDSVDIEVVTKDLFTLTGGLDVKGISRVRAKLAENNLLGMGQSLQYTTLVDRNRRPSYGYEVLYSKNNIAHSFVNASVGYTLINTGRSTGSEEEKSLFLRLDRPLFSPYARVAGGLEISRNHSENFYRKPDTSFYNYSYHLYDLWGGYNLGVTKLLQSKDSIRDRSFLALRYLRTNFKQTPDQIGEKFDPLYNNTEALLAEFTFFRQDFYRTNYIYGFGTTEDVPYGFNIALTGGWYKQLKLSRPYTGVNANYFIATKKGEFLQFFYRTGGYWSSKRSQDANMLIGTNLYSRLYLYKSYKIREYIRLSFARQFNRTTQEPLRIDNSYGVQFFRADSTFGRQRISLYSETFVFTKYKALGFQLAPFVFTDLSLLTPENKNVRRSNLYTGIGGGLRTRNENLIFGTMELRIIYFPNTIERNRSFKISFRSNIRFRFVSRYIKPPNTIQLNSGDEYTF
jgi:hypothetical protein